MTKEILIPWFIFLFVAGMGLHAWFVSTIRKKYTQLYKDLGEPGLFTARNFKAQNFIAKQALSPNGIYSDLTTQCRILFLVQAVYLLVFVNVVISIWK